MRTKIAYSIFFILLRFSSAYASDYSCGTLSGTVLSVPDDYMFFPMEPVGGIWGEVRLNTGAKNCQRKIQSVTLELYYPSLAPATGYNVFNDPDNSHIEIAVVALSRTTDRTLISRVNRYSEEMRKLGPVSETVIASFTGLSGVDPVYGKGKVDFLWQGSGEKITDTLMCRYYENNPDAAATCQLSYFAENMRASVVVQFSTSFIDQVEDIKKTSIMIINKFSQKEL